jgi:hypothetical protein
VTTLSPAALDLLAAVERGEVVRMLGGRTWDIERGVFRNSDDMEPLLYAELVTVERVTSPQMDRPYVLNPSGSAALTASREVTQ